MKKNLPEQYRVTKGPFASIKDNGANGAFIIPNPVRRGTFFQCIISDAMGWDHVSVTLLQPRKSKAQVNGSRHIDMSALMPLNIVPSWAEMCAVKDLFFESEEPAMQIHPPESMYVNNHPTCLHLWRSQGQPIPFPHPLMVGIMGYELGARGRAEVRAATPKNEK